MGKFHSNIKGRLLAFLTKKQGLGLCLVIYLKIFYVCTRL